MRRAARSRLRRATTLGVLAAVWLTACGTPMVIFLHRGHRTNYALQAEELKGVQFYISVGVLAHEIDIPEEGAPESVFIVEMETPGVVTDVGPDWLRVSFDQGAGVHFVTGRDSSYWLATAVDGEDGLHILKGEAEPVLLLEGRRFRLVRGADARLLVNVDDLLEAIERRRHAQGREAGR